jgi:hypothetical protein
MARTVGRLPKADYRETPSAALKQVLRNTVDEQQKAGVAVRVRAATIQLALAIVA